MDGAGTKKKKHKYKLVTYTHIDLYTRSFNVSHTHGDLTHEDHTHEDLAHEDERSNSNCYDFQ